MKFKSIHRRNKKNVANQDQLKLLKSANKVKTNFCQNMKDQYQGMSRLEDTYG